MGVAAHPDVALVDYQMPDLDGMDVVHAVVRDRLPTRVLLLSAVTDSAVVYRALQEGGAGYLAKDANRPEIVEAVRRVARGETVLRVFSRGRSIPQLAAELFLGAEHGQDHGSADDPVRRQLLHLRSEIDQVQTVVHVEVPRHCSTERMELKHDASRGDLAECRGEEVLLAAHAVQIAVGQVVPLSDEGSD